MTGQNLSQLRQSNSIYADWRWDLGRSVETLPESHSSYLNIQEKKFTFVGQGLIFHEDQWCFNEREAHISVQYGIDLGRNNVVYALKKFSFNGLEVNEVQEQMWMFFREAEFTRKVFGEQDYVDTISLGDNQFGLVMPFKGPDLYTIEEESIKSREDKEAIFSLDVALDIAIEVVFAVYSLHQNNIAHCDLKPENIAFDRNGKASLIDFGLASEEVDGYIMGPRGTTQYWPKSYIIQKSMGKSWSNRELDQFALLRILLMDDFGYLSDINNNFYWVRLPDSKKGSIFSKEQAKKLQIDFLLSTENGYFNESFKSVNQLLAVLLVAKDTLYNSIAEKFNQSILDLLIANDNTAVRDALIDEYKIDQNKGGEYEGKPENNNTFTVLQKTRVLLSDVESLCSNLNEKLTDYPKSIAAFKKELVQAVMNFDGVDKLSLSSAFKSAKCNLQNRIDPKAQQAVRWAMNRFLDLNPCLKYLKKELTGHEFFYNKQRNIIELTYPKDPHENIERSNYADSTCTSTTCP